MINNNITNPWRIKNYENKLGTNEQLCWHCKNFATCSWSKGIPVEGWDAIETELNVGHDRKKVTSYMIIDCPQFEFDR